MKPPTLTMRGQYEVLRSVQGPSGVGKLFMGEKGACRYCLRSAGVTFSQIAHAFPEALGNKWIISKDECDDCNQLFSRYEGALADAVAPLLTLGGTKGKGNSIRQTGRSAGSSKLTRDESQDRAHISVFSSDIRPVDAVRTIPSTGEMVFRMLIPGVPFRPRHAYKALCRMALAMLPDDYRPKYETMRKWLLNVKERDLDQVLDVALSFGSIGNAPDAVAGVLLKRTDPASVGPELLFQFCAGSVCLQINLRSDEETRHGWQPGAVNIRWSMVIEGDEGNTRTIDYGEPVHLDWSQFETQPQPLEAMELYFHPSTRAGRFVPIFRAGVRIRAQAFLPAPNTMVPASRSLTQAPGLQPIKGVSDRE